MPWFDPFGTSGSGGGSGDSYTKQEINTLLEGKQNVLVAGTNLDTTPIENSTNPITSGGVYAVIGNINSILEEVL